MKTLDIYTAQPIGDRIASDVTIRLAITIPEPDNTHDGYKKYDDLFLDQAERLEEVLISTLPGGTYDRLLGLMLKRKSSHFIVSHRQAGPDRTFLKIE